MSALANTREQPQPRRLAVFLSHNSHDKPIVESIARSIDQPDFEFWLDKWNLVPGTPWQPAIEDALTRCDACIVFVGPSGMGAWQHEEMRIAISRQVTQRGCRVVPVLLPGAERGERTQLPAFLVANTWVEFRRSVDDKEHLRRLVCAIRGVPPGRAAETASQVEECPFRGLQQFDLSDSDNFYGREAETQWLLDALRPKGIDGRANRFLAIVGASGSGKSSLARAGLLSEIAKGQLLGSEDWPQVVFKPGAHPIEQLGFAAAPVLGLGSDATKLADFVENCLASPRTLHQSVGLALANKPETARVVVLVDQFEEIFTQCDDDTLRLSFVDNLLYAASVPDGRTLVIITLRADFVGKCAGHAELANMISAHQELVGPLSDKGLRAAIEWPSRRAGRVVSPELVDTLVDEVRSAPASLPLLQHVLLVLWGHPDGMTLEAHSKIGRLEGALARHADQIIDSLQVSEDVVRRIFRRLTSPGKGTEDTRRRAPRSELITMSTNANDVDRLLQRLARYDARLLVLDTEASVGDTIVEVAHEALIRSWPKLQRWIDEDREGLHIQRRITTDAAEWAKSRDPSLLYRGARLAQASDWRLQNESDLNDIERTFLGASSSEAQRERDREMDLLRQKANRTLIWYILGLLMLVGVGMFWRNHDLTQIAKEQARMARGRELAARATNTLNHNLPLALLLGVRANRADTAEARTALAEAFAFEPQLKRFLWGHSASARSLAFSSRGMLASASWDQSVIFWDVSAGKRRKVLGDFGSPVNCLAFTTTGSVLAAGTTSGFVSIFDVEAGKRQFPAFQAHKEVTSVSFSGDGKLLASGGFDGGLALWNAQTGKIVRWLQRPGHEADKRVYSPILSVSLAPDGKLLASGTADGTVVLWQATSGQRMPELIGGTLSGESGQVRSVAFNREGDRLAAGRGRHIVVWDVPTRTELYNLDGPRGVSSVAFSEKGNFIGSAGDDGRVIVWNTEDQLMKFNLRGHTDAIHSVAFSSDGKMLASAAEDLDSPVILWHLGKSEQHAILASGERGKVHGVAFHPDGGLVASAGVDAANGVGTVTAWDTASGKLMLARESHKQGSHSVAFSADGKQLATGGSEGEVVISDVSTLTQLYPLSGHKDVVSSIAFSPDGQFLASASWDESVLVRGGPSWQIVRSMPGPPSKVASVSFGVSSNGPVLAAGYFSGDIILWNPSNGKQLLPPLSGHKRDVVSLAFSHDGATLVSGSLDGSVILWNPSSGEKLGEPLIGNRGEVFSVALSQSDKVVATGTADGTVVLWATDTGARLSELRGHAKPVYGVVFSNDGRTLVSGGEDGRVILHNVQMPLWGSYACDKANRNLKQEEWIEFGPDDKYSEVCGDRGLPQGESLGDGGYVLAHRK